MRGEPGLDCRAAFVDDGDIALVPVAPGLRGDAAQRRSRADHGEAPADRLVEQPSIGQARLREDDADGRRGCVARAGTELRLGEVEDLGALLAEVTVARGGAALVGRLDDAAEIDRELDEGANVGDAFEP